MGEILNLIESVSGGFPSYFLYIARITINNNTPHLKSPKNQNRRAALGQLAIKLLGGFTVFEKEAGVLIRED